MKIFDCDGEGDIYHQQMMRKILLRSLAMVVVSCLVGLLANRMGPGLPILTAYTPVAQVFIQAQRLDSRGHSSFRCGDIRSD